MGTTRPPLVIHALQASSRDISLAFRKHESAGKVEKAARSWKGKGMHVKHAALLERYSDSSMPPWEVRLGISVVLQPEGPESPRTDALEAALDSILKRVAERTGARLADESERGFWREWNDRHGEEWVRDHDHVSTAFRVTNSTAADGSRFQKKEWMVRGAWTSERPRWSLEEWMKGRGAHWPPQGAARLAP